MTKTETIARARQILLPLRDEDRVARLLASAQEIGEISVHGRIDRRFYSGDLGLGLKPTRGLRAAGYGETIMTGKGSHSGVVFFPIEILERVVSGFATA